MARAMARQSIKAASRRVSRFIVPKILISPLCVRA
jgi:hypothetical protein